MPILSTLVFDAPDSVYAELGSAISRMNLKTWDGFLGAWIGRVTDDKCTINYREVHIVLAWSSLEAYNTTQSQPSYTELVSRHLTPLQALTHRVHFACTGDNPLIAFSSPLTEVLLHKIKAGETKERLNTVVAGAVRLLEDSNIGVRMPRVDGEILESTGDAEFYTAIGWDGPEAHEDAVKLEGLKEYFVKFLEVADINQAWVKFEKLA